jgi:hypothetical protein
MILLTNSVSEFALVRVLANALRRNSANEHITVLEKPPERVRSFFRDLGVNYATGSDFLASEHWP